MVRERREGSRCIESTPSLPRVYFVPRGGVLVRFAAELRDDLCELRSELELLRRIRRRLAVPPAPQTRPSARSRNLDELLQILRDAQHPVVDEMTALLDREFPDVREEVAMTVINEEAENIVQEAVDSGALDAAAAKGGAVTSSAAPGCATEESSAGVVADGATASIADGSAHEVLVEPGMTAAQTATRIESALAEAEAALAQVVGIPSTEGRPSPSTPGDVSPPEAMRDASASEPTGATGSGDGHVASAVEDASECGDGAPMASASSAPGPTERSSVYNEAPSADTSVSADAAARAVRAVAEIEHGVRKLAALLSTEVNDQWRRADGTLDELVHARDEAADLAASVRASLDAILRLRADAQAACDDAKVVQQEARLLREETQRAKQRAEAAAEAAELAADQAMKERIGFPCAGATVTQTLP